MNAFLSSAREMVGELVNEEPSRKAGTILYVEDEKFVREVTSEVLRAAGYQVLVAKNAAEAMDIYEGWKTDVNLLLTDVILPGDTGGMLATRLRRSNPRLKVLYVTGYAEQMGIRRTANEDCLAKPFSTDGLLDRVGEMIGRRQSKGLGEDAIMLACAGG